MVTRAPLSPATAQLSVGAGAAHIHARHNFKNVKRFRVFRKVDAKAESWEQEKPANKHEGFMSTPVCMWARS